MSFRILFRRGTAQEWTLADPILRSGEPGLEQGSNKFKIGDGVRRWSQLPYFVDQEAATPTGSDGSALSNHIFDPTPHEAYDDMPSLTLLYQNAKV